MIDEREILANKLKKFRAQENINQFDFAEDCGISREALSLIEREKENVTIDTIQLLAARMGVTVSDLFNHGDVTYFVMPGVVEIENEKRTTYGIGAIYNGVLITEIRDISTNYNKIKNLVYLCNNENLSPIHLMDVVEDFLAE